MVTPAGRAGGHLAAGGFNLDGYRATALRLARYFGTTPGFWLNLQTAYDLEEVEREEGKSIISEVKPFQLAHA